MRDRCDLIKAVHWLIKEGLHVRLTIIGKKCINRPMNLVRELGIEKKVIFTGELPREKVVEYLSTSDLEAHWITNPGLGTATLEAMGYGLPCLAFGYERLFDGIPLEDGKNILFVRPGDVTGIANRLRELYYCPIDKRKEIGEEARNLVQSFFTWASIARKLESYYRKTIDEYNSYRG
jgi:glycosyltransferase involved in cell wall biosynthesis